MGGSGDQNEARPSIPEITGRLRAALPGIARDLITAHQDMSDPANVSFAAGPDSSREHSPRWHQYGILTHSERFHDALRTAVPELLQRWGLAEPAAAALSVPVDGVPKGQLLLVAALLHDVGKFTARTVKRRTPEAAPAASFDGHEAHSGRIIRGELKSLLAGWKLSEAHRAYLAKCAELHFELGKVRRASKSAGGYTMVFAQSPEFATAIAPVLGGNPDFALEIGVQFIADSLSKTSVAATSQTDADIAAERPALERSLIAKGLDPRLVDQALQQPVNLKVAEGYLRRWATLA
jgi:HD domain-containing protein